MQWLYLAAGVAIFIKILVLPDSAIDFNSVVEIGNIVRDSGVPNAVSAIILRNRLYDTIFEVVVFTIAIMGVRFLLADESPTSSMQAVDDAPSIVLARLGAIISALIAIELAIRGHLSPGGGFAAGVAGGTAIGLVAITVSREYMEAIYDKWNAAIIEKLSVLAFIFLALLTLLGYELPHRELGTLLSGGKMPLLNMLVALKVALGSWAAILLFIRYRGLL